MKSRGGLIHPNLELFKLITAIENSFELFCIGEHVGISKLC